LDIAAPVRQNTRFVFEAEIGTWRTDRVSQLVRAKITALGAYVPPRLLTNDDLEKLVETSNDWIVERTGIPVGETMAGKGSIADTHPLAVGVCGRYSRKVANDTLAAADFCLAIGTKLSSMGTNVFQYPGKGTRIVHIDLDANSLGRTYREELSIVGDSREALKMLREAALAARVNGGTHVALVNMGSPPLRAIAWRSCARRTCP